MAVTRKEFVLGVVEEMKKNPRAVLAGHGISAAVLQTIVARPDVMSKLATVLYSTAYAKKGAAGLKKAPNFKISGYKSFADFNVKAREDVETFVGGLSAEDSAQFNNSDNILTIILLPEAPSTGDDSTINQIVAGKSVAITFDSAVRKEFKIPGGMYLTVMMGESAARPAEAAVAERKEKVNKAKQVRRTPAKIQSELKAKAAKKLAILKAKRDALQETAYNTEKELQQYSAIGQQFGVNPQNPGADPMSGITNFNAGVKDAKSAIAALSPDDKKVYSLAVKYLKAGKTRMANTMMAELNNPVITNYLKGGMQKNANGILDTRKNAILDALKSLITKNEQYLLDLGMEANAGRKLSIRSMISKNNAKIREYRAKLGTYNNISAAGMNKKAQMLKQTHAEIEANIAAGASISQALHNALNKLPLKAAQKQIIKQQIMQQVAQDKPMQFAVQQAIQDNVAQAPTALSDNFGIENLLATL